MTNHVKVKVGPHFSHLRIRAIQLFDVIERAQFSVLFGAPKCKSNSILDSEFGESNGYIQDTN